MSDSHRRSGRRHVPWLAALLSLVTASVGWAVVPNPTVTGPIPANAGPRGHALFDSWYDLADLGYVEEEYFLSGTAKTYTATPTTAPYTTRIIVSRPADPSDFNGAVLLDWVNVTAQFENAVDSIETHEHLLREGYAFVHMSAQSVGICCSPLTPKVWDPVRYMPLSHPGDNYSFDIFSQAAQALKHPQGIDPMGGLQVEVVIAAGQSQSGGRLSTYVRQVQADAGVIDAFLIHSSGSKIFPAEPLVPVIHLLSDAEADPEEPNVSQNYRLWEIAGTAHSNYWIGYHQEVGSSARTLFSAPKQPGAADEALHPEAGIYGEQVRAGQLACVLQGAEFPARYATSAAVHYLNRWARTGTPPPAGPRYEFDALGVLALDEFGNARGGIRLPPIDVPVAQYVTTACGLGGVTIAFTEAQLLMLYPTHADYSCLMQEASEASVAAGFLLPPDAEDLMTRVAGAVNRWPLSPGVRDCDDDQVPDAADNCPHVANPGQEDGGGINTAAPDGIGNACQCGDVTGEGVVNGQDGVTMTRHGLGITPNPLFVVPGNCDVSGNGICNGQDGVFTTRAGLLLADPPALAPQGQNCQNADPFAPPCTNCGP